MDIYQRLKELNIVLPEAPGAKASYVPVKMVGNIAYLSGQGAFLDGKLLNTGKVGKDITVKQAQEAARQTAINILATLHEFLGDLNKVKSVVKLLGFVACADGFNEQPSVINAASELFIDVFGENGRHARSAVGTNELPLGMSVEIESVFEIDIPG